MCLTCGCEHDEKRLIQVEKDLLQKNNEYANANREYFKEHNIFALNFVSSPGSGKTSLLVKTINDLKEKFNMAVIEGDQQTDNDVARIKETNVPAIQINTGKGCHLDAHQVGHAIDHLALQDDSFLFIENVGNLVCPASFDLGEAYKVAVLSVTEGEDKPIKYPDMFYAADVMLLNKIDLLPYLDFDVEKCIEYARRVNSKLTIIQISIKSGEGLDEWYRWLANAGK